MKCINRVLLYALCITAVFTTGCGKKETLEKEYDVYSYTNSFTNTAVSSLDDSFFADELCVTDAINFGTESITYTQVAQNAAVFNVTTNEVLYNQNMFEQLYPASTTKILTAYIILRDCTLTDVVTISESAVDQEEDSQVCGFSAGDNVTVKDLLYGLMVYSGNDAAEALAEYHSGSMEAFAIEMTNTAHSLGATNSQFKNPSGMPDKEHYTTVYDMYLIFNEAIKNETFLELTGCDSQRVIYTNANGETVEKTFTAQNFYSLGKAQIPDGFEVVGLKTGTTYAAGYCLVLYTKNPTGQDIISIVYKADGKSNLYLLMNEILSKFAN